MKSACALAEEGNILGIRELIKREPNAHTIRAGFNNSTPLINAAKGGFSDIVKFLIESGANLNSTERAKQTALHVACAGDHIATAKELIIAGADVSIVDKTGKKPLECCEDVAHRLELETCSAAHPSLPPNSPARKAGGGADASSPAPDTTGDSAAVIALKAKLAAIVSGEEQKKTAEIQAALAAELARELLELAAQAAIAQAAAESALAQVILGAEKTRVAALPAEIAALLVDEDLTEEEFAQAVVDNQAQQELLTSSGKANTNKAHEVAHFGSRLKAIVAKKDQLTASNEALARMEVAGSASGGIESQTGPLAAEIESMLKDADVSEETLTSTITEKQTELDDLVAAGKGAIKGAKRLREDLEDLNAIAEKRVQLSALQSSSVAARLEAQASVVRETDMRIAALEGEMAAMLREEDVAEADLDAAISDKRDALERLNGSTNGANKVKQLQCGLARLEAVGDKRGVLEGLRALRAQFRG